MSLHIYILCGARAAISVLLFCSDEQAKKATAIE